MKTWALTRWREHQAAMSACDDDARTRSAPALTPLLAITVAAALGTLMVDALSVRKGPDLIMRLCKAIGPDAHAYAEGLFSSPPNAQFHRFVVWLLAIQVFYVVVPYVAARRFGGFRMSTLGVSVGHARRHLAIYAVITGLVLTPVIIAAVFTSVGNYYPMYPPARGALFEFVRWELVYLPQFFAVEFLFRGVLLFPFARHFGRVAVLIPIIPYALIHVGKPFGEAMGAIVAGLVLGNLALASKSIWPGVIVHVVVAFTVDFLSALVHGTTFQT